MIVVLPSIPRVPEDLSMQLRRMADQVDEGRITACVACVVLDGDYELLIGTSISQSIVLSALLHRRTVDSMIPE